MGGGASTTGRKVKIGFVDLLVSENRATHHTSAFEDKQALFLRRGATFSLEVQLGPGTPYSEVSSRCKVVLSHKSGPTFELPSVIDKYHAGRLHVTSTLPSSQAVGRFKATVEYWCTDGVGKFEVHTPLTVLFNPWRKEDDTYMADTSLLSEYVLAEQGFVYRSKVWGRALPAAWHYDQFDTAVTETVLELVERMPWGQRSSPVLISRQLSALVNAPDEAGILVGNWSGDYSGGTPPFEWSGSGPILQQFREKGTPVKYGQCWVFAGVLTTALRTLGIPARPVTNYSSAHDTDGSRHVEYYFDGPTKLSKSSDSVWNIHVWTEAWMTRPDATSDCDGWQAVDATPQERSGGLYQLGPAPVLAVKRGQSRSYDTDFVIAEVNADMRIFRKTKKGNFEIEAVLTDRIGKLVVTKTPGPTSEPLDITKDYKHAEGTISERVSLLRTAHDSSNAGGLRFSCALGSVTLGEDLTLQLKAKLPEASENASEEGSQDAKLQVRLRATGYTGRSSKVVMELDAMELIAPFDRSVSVPVDAYSKFLTDSGFWFEWEVHALVEKTEQTFADELKFELEFAKPMSVTVPPQCKVGSSVQANVTFVNPFKELTLTKGRLKVGAAARKMERFTQDLADLPPGEVLELRVPVQPKVAGELVVNYELDFEQLTDVQTYTTLQVHP